MGDSNQNRCCLSLGIRCVWSIVSCWRSLWGKGRRGRGRSSWGRLLGNDFIGYCWFYVNGFIDLWIFWFMDLWIYGFMDFMYEFIDLLILLILLIYGFIDFIDFLDWLIDWLIVYFLNIKFDQSFIILFY